MVLFKAEMDGHQRSTIQALIELRGVRQTCMGMQALSQPHPEKMCDPEQRCLPMCTSFRRL
jgi:hypothetical protein